MNKKLKKIGLLTISLSTSLALGLSNVKAIEIGSGAVNGYLGYNQSGITLEEESGVYKMSLEKDVAHDLEIKNGQKVVLNLNGHNMTNYTEAVSTIYVENGAELTIEGTGSVSQKTGSTNSVIGNYGKLVINGGSFVAGSTRQASIYNAGTLEFTSGSLTTSANDVFGLTNVGTATIKGGTFTQAHNYSVINNAGTMTIEDGKFTIAEGNTLAYSLITNQSPADKKATLTIKNGDFTGNKGVFFNEEGDEIAISGGTYKAEDTTDIEEFLTDGLELGTDGKVAQKPTPVVKDADYTKVEEALAKANELKKEDYTEETYKVLLDAIAAVEKDLDESKQAEVDKMAEDILKAIEGLKKASEIKAPNTADDYATNAVFGFVSLMGIGALSLVVLKRR